MRGGGRQPRGNRHPFIFTSYLLPFPQKENPFWGGNSSGRAHHLQERKTVVGRCLCCVLIGVFPFLFQELPLDVLGAQRKQGVVTKLCDVSETTLSFGHVTLIWVVLFLTWGERDRHSILKCGAQHGTWVSQSRKTRTSCNQPGMRQRAGVLTSWSLRRSIDVLTFVLWSWGRPQKV